MYKIVLFLLFCGLHSPDGVDAHGRLVGPPSRSSMWRYGFKNPPNYSDTSLFCGGKSRQYSKKNGGKCGLCGDPYDGVRENEAGGKYANGIIVKTFNKGSTMEVILEITAYHKGWSEFRLCKNDDVKKRITQGCLNENLLPLASDEKTTRLRMPNQRIVKFNLQLPRNLTCTQCVLQWKYNTGNSWGTDPDGTRCLGCGNQEQFYGCSDIAIKDSSATPGTTKKISTTTTQRPPTWGPTSKSTQWPPTWRPIPTSSTRSRTKSTSGPGVTYSPTHTRKQCFKYPYLVASDWWCDMNCNHIPQYCPRNICYCINSNEIVVNDKDPYAAENRIMSLLKALLSLPQSRKT